MLIETIN